MGGPGDLGLKLTRLKIRNLPLISQLIYTLSIFPLFDFLGVYQTLCLVSVLPRGTKRKEFCLHLNQKAKKKTALRGASKKSTSSND